MSEGIKEWKTTAKDRNERERERDGEMTLEWLYEVVILESRRGQSPNLGPAARQTHTHTNTPSPRRGIAGLVGGAAYVGCRVS